MQPKHYFICIFQSPAKSRLEEDAELPWCMIVVEVRCDRGSNSAAAYLARCTEGHLGILLSTLCSHRPRAGLTNLLGLVSAWSPQSDFDLAEAPIRLPPTWLGDPTGSLGVELSVFFLAGREQV